MRSAEAVTNSAKGKIEKNNCSNQRKNDDGEAVTCWIVNVRVAFLTELRIRVRFLLLH